MTTFALSPNGERCPRMASDSAPVRNGNIRQAGQGRGFFLSTGRACVALHWGGLSCAPSKQVPVPSPLRGSKRGYGGELKHRRRSVGSNPTHAMKRRSKNLARL